MGCQTAGANGWQAAEDTDKWQGRLTVGIRLMKWSGTCGQQLQSEKSSNTDKTKNGSFRTQIVRTAMKRGSVFTMPW